MFKYKNIIFKQREIKSDPFYNLSFRINNLELYVHKKQIMFIFHMKNEFFSCRINRMATPTLKFTHAITTSCVVFHQIPSLEFSLAFRTNKICMTHMSFHIMSMYMREPFEFFFAHRTSVIGKFDISN